MSVSAENTGGCWTSSAAALTKPKARVAFTSPAKHSTSEQWSLQSQLLPYQPAVRLRLWATSVMACAAASFERGSETQRERCTYLHARELGLVHDGRAVGVVVRVAVRAVLAALLPDVVEAGVVLRAAAGQRVGGGGSGTAAQQPGRQRERQQLLGTHVADLGEAHRLAADGAALVGEAVEGQLHELLVDVALVLVPVAPACERRQGSPLEVPPQTVAASRLTHRRRDRAAVVLAEDGRREREQGGVPGGHLCRLWRRRVVSAAVQGASTVREIERLFAARESAGLDSAHTVDG